jgi:molecular chaperone HtpG
MTENHSQTQTQTRATEQRTFSTEVQQLLHLMVHSLYSKKEIFLRELISNSSDAIDTLRFLALTRPELSGSVEAQESAIELAVDKDAKTLTVRDTGIGMNRQQVIDNIGTIARSGTGTLLKKLKEQRRRCLEVARCHRSVRRGLLLGPDGRAQGRAGHAVRRAGVAAGAVPL